MASICNDDWASLGVMSGHERKTLRLSSTDRRMRLLQVTAAGDTLLQAVIPAMLAAQQHLLAPLSEADRPQFMAMLKTMVNASNGLSRAPSDA